MNASVEGSTRGREESAQRKPAFPLGPKQSRGLHDPLSRIINASPE
jgi:hypothetical protein